MYRILGGVMALALATALLGAQQQTAAKKSSDQQPQMSSREGASQRAQQRLVREVRHELVMLPYYSVFDNLEYQVNGDTVVLMGQVTRPTLKLDAESAVKKIEGVERVENHIEVLPPSPFDDRIRLAVARAIFGSPQLSRYGWQAVPPIHIIVDHGHVTLTGVVDNETDRNVAEIQAKGVPDVFSVTNNLRVAKPS